MWKNVNKVKAMLVTLRRTLEDKSSDPISSETLDDSKRNSSKKKYKDPLDEDKP